MNHNWSTRKHHLYLQSAAGISCHSALSEDRIAHWSGVIKTAELDFDLAFLWLLILCNGNSLLKPLSGKVSFPDLINAVADVAPNCEFQLIWCILQRVLVLTDVLMQVMRWLASCSRCRCWKMMMSWLTRRLRLRKQWRKRLTADRAGCVYFPVTCLSGQKCCQRYVTAVC